jgi:hypothetical protein
MSANIENTLVEKVRALPIEKQRVLLDFVEELEKSPAQALPTLWDKVRDIIEAVPTEAWDELPKDGSINVDHYLYGHPKCSVS